MDQHLLTAKQQELGSCKQVEKHLIYFIKVLKKFIKVYVQQEGFEPVKQSICKTFRALGEKSPAEGKKVFDFLNLVKF